MKYQVNYLTFGILFSLFVVHNSQANIPEITHGPYLGAITESSVKVWVRTSEPADFHVVVKQVNGDHQGSKNGSTQLRDDNTGWVTVEGLQSGTEYEYHVRLNRDVDYSQAGTFRTVPSSEAVRNEQFNPEGLFNFKFGFGACNYQSSGNHHNPLMPAYQSMNDNIQDDLLFHVMHGDFIYESQRGTEVTEWQESNQLTGYEVPELLDIIPKTVGVWENYKQYYNNSPELREWHRNVPSYFMFDDHEILNDINATANAGYRHKRTVHRDVGLNAWQDYLGWANPSSDYRGDIHYGTAEISEGEEIFYDHNANFEALDEQKISNLHIHWNDDHPAAGVYTVKEIVDENRLRIAPGAMGSGENLSYSIGTNHFYNFEMGNAEIFVLDTRGMRELHDQDQPHQDISMLGETQKEWLIKRMQQSEADFLFVVSPSSFFLPHVGPRTEGKDESWTVYINERDELMETWEDLNKPVLLLTGDIHNAAAIQASDNVWEFLSGAQNSGHHTLGEDQAGRPTNGEFTYNDRTVDIHWSSFFVDDVPHKFRQKPIYSVVQLNNVFKNPTGDENPRWVAYDRPQVIVKYYDGKSGELLYSKSIRANEDS